MVCDLNNNNKKTQSEANSYCSAKFNQPLGVFYNDMQLNQIIKLMTFMDDLTNVYYNDTDGFILNVWTGFVYKFPTKINAFLCFYVLCIFVFSDSESVCLSCFCLRVVFSGHTKAHIHTYAHIFHTLTCIDKVVLFCIV